MIKHTHVWGHTWDRNYCIVPGCGAEQLLLGVGATELVNSEEQSSRRSGLDSGQVHQDKETEQEGDPGEQTEDVGDGSGVEDGGTGESKRAKRTKTTALRGAEDPSL